LDLPIHRLASRLYHRVDICDSTGRCEAKENLWHCIAAHKLCLTSCLSSATAVRLCRSLRAQIMEDDCMARCSSCDVVADVDCLEQVLEPRKVRAHDCQVGRLAVGRCRWTVDGVPLDTDADALDSHD